MSALRTLLLPLTALVGIALVIWAGSQPDYWMLRAMPVGSEAVYPLKPVLIFCAIVLAECSVLLAVLRPRPIAAPGAAPCAPACWPSAWRCSGFRAHCMPRPTTACTCNGGWRFAWG